MQDFEASSLQDMKITLRLPDKNNKDKPADAGSHFHYTAL